MTSGAGCHQHHSITKPGNKHALWVTLYWLPVSWKWSYSWIPWTITTTLVETASQ